MNVHEISTTALARMVEHTEAAAYADLLRAAPAAWRCSAEQTPAGWCLFAPTLDVLLFNRLIGCGLEAPAPRAELRAALARYRAAGLTHFGVQLCPAARPPGLAPRDNWSKVYRAAGDAPAVATDLSIEAIDQRHGASFAAITCTAFGMPRQLEPWIASTIGRPGWHHYLALDGADPVATGALFVYGDIGWLGIAGTLPSARRRGAQGALMVRRLKDGQRLGCRWFVTETGQETPERPNPSFHNMLRVGFTVAYHRPNYLPITA
jgi:hypothetical protein